MPLQVEQLTPNSELQAIRDAISASIAQCMREGGRTQEQCAAMTYNSARDKHGKSLGEGKQR